MKSTFSILKSELFEQIQAKTEKEYRVLRANGWKSKNRRSAQRLILYRKRKPWQLFEDRINIFFESALHFPFVKKGAHFGRSQVDIVAGIDDILLVIDCKTKEEPGPKNLHSYITTHAGKQGTILHHIRREFGNKYKKIYFILALKDIDYSEADIIYAEQSNVFLWGEKYIEVLEELYRILGPESRYYFLKELGTETIRIQEGRGKYYECPALSFSHNEVRVYHFFLEANKLLKLAYVARLESGNKDFYQRLVNKNRLGEIGRFIQENGTFKNSIIVSFENKPPRPKVIRSFWQTRDKKVDMVMLRLRKEYLSLWIIDGQHRLFGFTRVAEKFRENYLPVVAIENGGDTTEQAKTFVDINQKQKPVDSSLLWGLFDRLRPDKEEGAISRLVKRLVESGIFYGKVYIPGISRRSRKGYNIFFSNFCKGLLDQNIIDSKARNNLYHLMGKDGYGDIGDGVRRVAREVGRYFNLLSQIAKGAPRPKWISDFILTNNGLNVFLRVYSHCLHHFTGKIDHQELKNLLRVPLKQYFIERADAIDDLRRKTSSEGIREEIAYEIIRAINRHNEDFEVEYILHKNKEIREIDTYKAYVSLEKNLRNFTERKLRKISSNWWKERLPGDVRERAEEALRKGRSPDPLIDTQPRKPIDCLDFMDYPKVFTRSDNWRDVFKKFLRDDQWVSVKFREIKPIRNKIAHPVDMNPEEKIEFLKFCGRMNKILKR